MRQHLTLISIRSTKRLCNYSRAGCRGISTSNTVQNEKTPLVSDVPEKAVTSLRDLADVDISQAALEAGSNSGLAFIGNNVMGAFKWITGWLPSFGKSEVVWSDVVTPKVTHFYIPSIYEAVQNYTGAPWIVVIGVGTLTLRAILLPLTRRTMRMPYLTTSFVPKHRSYGEFAKLLKQSRQTELHQKVMKWQQNLAGEKNGGSTLMSFFASGFIMVTINRGLRHLSRVTPLMEGGVGPFLDMTVNSNASVGFYFLPICVVAGLFTNLHMNIRKQKWYNPRLAVVIVPVGGIFAFFIGKISVTLCLHYAISSWCSAALTIVQHTNHELLKLPPPLKVATPRETIRLTEDRQRSAETASSTSIYSASDSEKLDFTVEDLSGISPKTFQHHDQKSEEEFLKELTGKHLDAVQSGPTKFDTPYTPIFKLGQYKEIEDGSDTQTVVEDNFPSPPPAPGMLQRAQSSVPKFQFRKRFMAWYYRQKLMRHGKKGKMTLFLEDAPQEMNFVRDSVELTTKVTPGLKRYVLRRQYPMNTLEEMERKVSYIERVQNQRW
ncbi:hypothetical protein ACHWQZ_G017746 [Mnemiopsis leidyi]